MTKLGDKVRELHKFMRSDEWADAVSSIFDDIEELEARVAGESFINRTLSAEVSRLKERVNNVEALEGENHRLDKYYDEKSARINDLEFLMEQQTLGHAEVVRTLETELEETQQVAIASRWCSGFYSQVPGPGQIAQMFGGLLMGLTEYRRTDVRNAKIEAYEDVWDICSGEDEARDVQARIQARIDALTTT